MAKRKATSQPAQKPTATKKGLAGHAAPPTSGINNAAGVVDSGVAGVDAALASRALLHPKYHARLALVDPAKNSDKYYVLQVLVDMDKKAKSTSKHTYYVFSRWGRTGTGGQCQLQGPWSTEDEARVVMEKIFKTKTGSDFDEAVPGQAPRNGKYEYLAISSKTTVAGRWYYFLQNDPLGKADGWYPYDPENTQEVEDLYGGYVAAGSPARLSERFITSESSGFQYKVDLSAMVQTNLRSGTTRPIQRDTSGNPPTSISAPQDNLTITTPVKSKRPIQTPVAVVTPAPKPHGGGGIVDSAASPGLRHCAIYQDYNVMLNQTNLGANNNKFYKLQLLVDPSSGSGSTTLFTKWGRVGEPGKTQEQGPFADINDATKEFCKKFKSKTGNNFDDRANFVSKKGKYTLVEMEEEQGVATTAKMPAKYHPSELDAPTQQLINLIFDQDMFESAMSEMNLDPKKLPLGALSPTQIAKGFAVLEQLEQALESNAPGADLMDLTSQFYTLIPHAFGRSRGPVLDSMDKVQEKYEMLNTLADIEQAQAMQKQRSSTQQQVHPADLHYQQLAADLVLVDPTKSKKEYTCIQAYIKNTQGEYCDWKLRHVWRVNRHGEDQRYALHDLMPGSRKLLWHGTSVAVVAAILKSGLRIMPHSGGRVGRGIYLADQHAKSASYCQGAKRTVLMFLVEAALGPSFLIFQDDPSLTKAPVGFDSVLAKGRQEPDQQYNINIKLDGKQVVVPQGKPTESMGQAKNSSFDHNEYLIYKESQHRIRYVLAFDV